MIIILSRHRATALQFRHAIIMEHNAHSLYNHSAQILIFKLFLTPRLNAKF